MTSLAWFRLVVCLYSLMNIPFAFCAPKPDELKNTNSEGGCNFDGPGNKFCRWRQESGRDNFDWTWWKGRTRSGGTGPSKDHTTGAGGYAYIETSSPRYNGQKARLTSGPYSDVQCLHFSYSMIGDTIGSLTIYLNLHGLELDIWTRKGPQRSRLPEWNSANVTVYGRNYYIIIEGVVGRSYTGDIAIDDIFFTKGSCNGEKFSFQNDSKDTGGKCNFDLGLCNWANDLIDSSNSPWRLSTYRGSKKSSIQGPDHGKRIGGKYVYAENKQKQTTHRLVSEKLCAQKCVEMFYFTKEFRRSEFRLLARKVNDSNEDRVWFSTGDGSKTDDWTRAVVDINTDENTCFQLILEANLGRASKATVGLDDLLVTNGSCCPMLNTPEDSAKANCNFDEGTFCKWRQSPKSTFLWSIGSGKTSSGNASGGVTGPFADASGTGNYAYIESSEPQSKGDKAILVSDMMAGQQCMRFKYHMHGDDVGSLSIYRRGFLAWKEIGNHGNRWLEGQVDFDCNISQYQVEVEATVVGWRGDIAIDELRFTPDLCLNKSTDAATLPTLSVIPPPLPPPHSICTFNKNLCSWKNAFGDDGEWHLHQDETPSFGTGPHYDSDGNGYYIYMEASELLKGQKVRLESETFFSPMCLHFHYHMYGQDIDELRLEQRNLTDNSTKIVWSIKGEQEDYWHFGYQAFKGDHYTVSFVGVRGNSYFGDIALDEISVVGVEECEVMEQAGNLAQDQGKTVTEANCDFEKGLEGCKWGNLKGDTFDWTSQLGGTPSTGTGPDRNMNRLNKYMYIESSSPRRQGDKAVLRVKVEGRSFCMSFKYSMNGRSGMGTLTVKRIVKEVKDDRVPEVKDFEGGKVELQLKGHDGTNGKWNEASKDMEVLKSVRKGTIHWIAIVGEVGSSYTSDIAIDDVMFTPGRCAPKRKARN